MAPARNGESGNGGTERTSPCRRPIRTPMASATAGSRRNDNGGAPLLNLVALRTRNE